MNSFHDMNSKSGIMLVDKISKKFNPRFHIINTPFHTSYKLIIKPEMCINSERLYCIRIVCWSNRKIVTFYDKNDHRCGFQMIYKEVLIKKGDRVILRQYDSDNKRIKSVFGMTDFSFSINFFNCDALTFTEKRFWFF